MFNSNKLRCKKYTKTIISITLSNNSHNLMLELLARSFSMTRREGKMAVVSPRILRVLFFKFLCYNAFYCVSVTRNERYKRRENEFLETKEFLSENVREKGRKKTC